MDEADARMLSDHRRRELEEITPSLLVAAVIEAGDRGLEVAPFLAEDLGAPDVDDLLCLLFWRCSFEVKHHVVIVGAELGGDRDGRAVVLSAADRLAGR